jgi:hypothetical protein
LFPITHAYAVGRLVPAAGPLHILGAIFPDAAPLALTRLARAEAAPGGRCAGDGRGANGAPTNGLTWDQAHRSGATLYAFLRERAPAGLPFAVGMITHGVMPAGLDYYGDQKYGDLEKGYAFEEARPYAICHLPAAMGWWKGHNFVEMAIEWLIARQHPQLGTQVAQTLAQAREFAFLSAPLAAFFERDGLDLLRSLPAMVPFLALDRITPAALAERYQRQVQLKHGVEGIEVDQAAALIEEVAGAIQPRCWAFLQDVLEKIGAMLEAEGWG